MRKFLILYISAFFLIEYGVKILALRYNKEFLNSESKGNFFVQDLNNYKHEIESQITNFKKGGTLSNEIDYQLKELNDLVTIVRDTQNSQRDKLVNFSNSLEQTKLSLLKMLSEYENRIGQLEYQIMEIKKFDPFIEKFNYPISKFWLKLDFNNIKSYWKYKKNKKYITIIQENDITNLKKPSTILLLKHHRIINGYVNVDLLPSFSHSSKINQSSSGIIFNFINAHNYRFVELHFINSQSFVIVSEVINDDYKRIISKNVDANSSEFSSLTCEFVDKKINIYFNYKKIIEINDTDSNVKNSIGLFTKIGTAQFKNILSGNLNFEKELHRKLLKYKEEDVAKIKIIDSYRFSDKNSRDDLSVYEIPYVRKDYDNYLDKDIDDVYPVPDPNSSYEENNLTFTNFDKSIKEEKHEQKEKNENLCNNYKNTEFYLNDWINNNTLYKWKSTNEYGLNRVFILGSYKNSISKSSLVYKHSSCNYVNISTYVKLENDSEAGLLFRYNNKGNMYIVTISTKNKEIILKEYKNNREIIIKSEYAKNINSFQRHHILINDDGNKGIINVYLDNTKMISINNENYYKSGSLGLYVEYGYAMFDTFKIQNKESKNI